MKKPIMKLMALLLAGVMTVTPVSTSYAAMDTSVDVAVVDAEVVTEEETDNEIAEDAAEDAMTDEVAEETAEDEATVSTEEAETEIPVEETEETETKISEEEITDSGEEVIVPEDEAEENVDEEETLSENEVEDSTLSDNTVSDNEAEALFPGLPEDYILTGAQATSKKTLRSNLGEIDEMEEGIHYIPGELIYSTDSIEEAQMIADAYGATLKSCFDGVAVIQLPETVTVSQAVHAAADEKNHLPAVYPNYYRYLYTEDAENMQPNSVMNDPYLLTDSAYYQWQHYAVGSMYAWELGYTGAGIDVAVIDSGVATSHEDIAAVYNYNALTGTAGAADDNTSGHGTHVAGIIAATGDNDKGGSGIAPDAKIYNLKVFDGNDTTGASGSAATVTRAINKATELGVDIINMSLGGVGYTEEEHQSVKDAVNAGIAVFVAAGNDGARGEAYPAAFEESICIAAVDKNLGKASFTNFGSWVDLCAPGVGIYSTYPISLESNIGVSGYYNMNGTSQACPTAAGTAALILSANLPELVGKTGAEKVAALEAVMESHVKKSTSKEVGAGMTYLPYVLGMTDATTKPVKPEISLKGGTITETGKTTTISTVNGCELWYSLDGKNPTLKNGVVLNAVKAAGTSQVLHLDDVVNAKTGKVTVKAIAVNKYSGVAGPVATTTYTLKTAVESVTITGATVNVPAGKSLTLKATVTPAYAANKAVEWSIDAPQDSGVTITTGGVVKTTGTAVADTYTVTAIPKDGKGGTPGKYSVTVTAEKKIKSIKFNPTSVKLDMKATPVVYDLAANMEAFKVDDSVAEASDFIWTSSKPEVATVDKTTGEVRTVGAGTTTITALAADGSNVKKTCNVTVVQLARTITITQPVDKTNTDTVLLAAGKGVALKANVLPATTKNKAVVWTMDAANESGVSVSTAGKVTAKADAKEGSYTVTAKAKDGSETYDTITVNVYHGAATKVTLDKKTATIFRKSTDYGLATSVDIVVTPTGAVGHETDYTVTSSNENIVKVTKNGNIVTAKTTEKAAGTATVKVVMNDGSGKSATCKVTVKNPLSGLSIAPAAGRTGDIAKGKTLKLSAVYEEEFGAATKKVKWSVLSGADYASVNAGGVVKAKKGLTEDGYVGTALIQAEATDGSGIKTTYRVYTWEAPKGIELECEQIATGVYTVDVLYKSDAYKYGSWYLPVPYEYAGVCPEIEIEIDKPQCIRVNNSYTYGQFKVYLVGAGRAKITVKALDGSGKKATLPFTIIE